jgi:acetolactate synthase-1/2/3 large subunit
MPDMTGGEAVVATLQALSIDTVFGIPSVHNLPIVDAMTDLAAPRLVVVRHEQGAAHMADGFYRATGRVAAALTSTGPGAANSITGLWEAYHAGSPLLTITGQIATRWLDRGHGQLHEVDHQPEFLGAVVKRVFRVERVADIPDVLTRAAHLSVRGRPGPVAVEIPIDLQYQRDTVEIPHLPWPGLEAPSEEEVRAAVRLIGESRSIVIWAGGGAVRSGAGPRLQTLAERTGAVIVTSTNGRGAVDELHPQVAGAFTTDPAVRAYLEDADLWIGVGTRFRYDATAEWAIKPPRRLIHINVDRAARDRSYRSDLFVAADARLAIDAIVKALPDGNREVSDMVGRLHQEPRERAYDRLGPWRPVAEAIAESIADQGILVCDATIPAYAFGNRVVPVRHRHGFLYPTTAAIGPGLPLAIGAQVGAPERPVILLAGDGGFLLDVGDLATAARYRVPVVFVVFNDHAYGILKRVQEREFGRLHGVQLNAPDFVKLAEAFGMRALHARSAAGFRDRLREAVALREPVLLEMDMSEIGPVPLGGGRPAAAESERDRTRG